MKVKTLNEWLNESRNEFLEPTRENLRKYGLNPNKVNINPDGSIDYDGNVNLSWYNLTSIPFNFNKVNGNFICSDNLLVSLEGCPNTVKGSFYCRENQLTSLSGCPRVVEGSFNCSGNRLVSLEGCPREGIKSFNCSENQLVSLEGCPGVVGGRFDCYTNLLVSLAGAPKEVEGLFDCTYNPILYNPTKYNGAFDINKEWHIKDSSGKWAKHSGYDVLRVAFGRLDELTREEILGIEEGLKKVNLPDDLRSYCERALYKFLVKLTPQTKTQKFFHDAEMDDDLMDML